MAKIRDDLVGSVLIENPEGGDPIVLVAGSKVPEGVVLGDHVLAAKSGGGSKGSGKGKDTGKAGTSPSESDKGSGSASGGDLTVPPMVGAGSGADAWREYAVAAAVKAGLSIEIPEGAKRGEIIAALESAEIPVK